ncbi:MAG: GDSL-type esterase/lipase family protein [Bacteroidota bacterium]
MNKEIEIEKEGWLEEIFEIKERSRTYNHIRKPTAFYGSSSIRLWDTMEHDLHPVSAVNLGFGGSSYFWCDHFFEEVFEFVDPSKVVLYAGDNDLGNAVPEAEILGSVDSLLMKIERKYGFIPVAIISVKPSPDRYHLTEKIMSLNRHLSDLMHSRKNGSFIDIYSAMLHTDGALRPELYIEDGLHINSMGYEIWKMVLKQHLVSLR